jgi:hypothetical protein
MVTLMTVQSVDNSATTAYYNCCFLLLLMQILVPSFCLNELKDQVGHVKISTLAQNRRKIATAK